MHHARWRSRANWATTSPLEGCSPKYLDPWSIIPLTIGAKYALHIIGPIRRLPTAQNPNDERDQLHEILGAEVACVPRQRSERVRHRQVRPCTWDGGYRAIGALIPDAITVSAGPFVDQNELLAQERMERMGDADSRRRRCGIGCS